jgi:malonyl-CoA decarboxylase
MSQRHKKNEASDGSALDNEQMNQISPSKREFLSRIGLTRRSIARAWAGLIGQTQFDGFDHLHQDLEGDDVNWIKSQIDSCLNAEGGAASARTRAAQLGRAYLGLSDVGKSRFFKLLLDEYGHDRTSIRESAGQILRAKNEQEFVGAHNKMRMVLSPRRLELFRQFNSLEEGVKFLVDMRADLIDLARNDPKLGAISEELKDLLRSWFDIGFLDLRQITWDAPASLLEKLVSYEAVHEIRSWDDLKNRLDSDRRCYAFFHPNMPSEPLIFVEVALVNGIAENIHELLDEEAPAVDANAADTAIFYSISNAQSGLAGVAFGDFLIKRVVNVLSHELPNLKHFATLSPIPGFRRWLEKAIKGPPPLLDAKDAQSIGELAGGSDPAAAMLQILDQEDWREEEAAVEILKPILLRLCARYLSNDNGTTNEMQRARDPVEHFHLTNGARVERLNWGADFSKNGLQQSAGMMVNYQYRLNDIEVNHERYKDGGAIATSSVVKALA